MTRVRVRVKDCQNPEFKILYRQTPELKILYFQTPEFKILHCQNPEFNDFGLSKSWIQEFVLPISWIKDFGLPKSWIQDFGLPKSWIQDFGSPKSCIQDFGPPKSCIQDGRSKRSRERSRKYYTVEKLTANVHMARTVRVVFGLSIVFTSLRYCFDRVPLYIVRDIRERSINVRSIKQKLRTQHIASTPF